MGTKLSNLRTLNSNFARAYKYSFSITDLAALTSRLSLPTLKPEELETSCLNVVMPNEGTQMIEVEVGIHTMKLNGRKDKGGVINPEFILNGNYDIYKFFRAWQFAAAPDVLTEVQTPSGLLLATIHITARDVKNDKTTTIELQNAWCRNCNEINFSDDSNDIVRWSPEIVYEFSQVIQ